MFQSKQLLQQIILFLSDAQMDPAFETFLCMLSSMHEKKDNQITKYRTTKLLDGRAIEPA